MGTIFSAQMHSRDLRPFVGQCRGHLEAIENYKTLISQCDYYDKEVFICTAVQIILWLFAQVHCRAAFTLSSRLPLFVYTLQLTVLYVAGGDAMLTGEDEGETNTNSLVVQ